jgi:hypothetical protein
MTSQDIQKIRQCSEPTPIAPGLTVPDKGFGKDHRAGACAFGEFAAFG